MKTKLFTDENTGAQLTIAPLNMEQVEEMWLADTSSPDAVRAKVWTMILGSCSNFNPDITLPVIRKSLSVSGFMKIQNDIYDISGLRVPTAGEDQAASVPSTSTSSEAAQ